MAVGRLRASQTILLPGVIPTAYDQCRAAGTSLRGTCSAAFDEGDVPPPWRSPRDRSDHWTDRDTPDPLSGLSNTAPHAGYRQDRTDTSVNHLYTRNAEVPSSLR